MAKRVDGRTKDFEEVAVLLANIVLSVVNTLQITLDEKWASVSDMIDFQQLRGLTDALERFTSYNKENIAELLANDAAGIPFYLFASRLAFERYLAVSCLPLVDPSHV